MLSHNVTHANTVALLSWRAVAFPLLVTTLAFAAMPMFIALVSDAMTLLDFVLGRRVLERTRMYTHARAHPPTPTQAARKESENAHITRKVKFLRDTHEGTQEQEN